MSYPTAPPSSGGPGAPRHLRGRVPLLLALIFGLLGVALIVSGVFVLVAKFGAVDDYQRVTFAQQSRTIHFGRTGGYVAYYEAPGANFSDEPSTPIVHLTVTSSSGTAVTVRQYGGTATYSLSGHSGTAIGTFQISRSGNYRVSVQAGGTPSGADMAFGESFAGGLVSGILLIVPGVPLIVVAVILLIVGLVRRSGHKRELATRGGYGWAPPPGGFFGGPPQGGNQGGGYQGGPPPTYQGGGYQGGPPPSGYQSGGYEGGSSPGGPSPGGPPQG